MQFPYSYFDDEVRDGFFVPALMKRAWAAQMEILEDVAAVCKKHNIRWFADCGTLLGAIRHNGFVPWDDDLDICMLRDDYTRFFQVAQSELPHNYSVMSFHTDDAFIDMLLRVVNGKEIHLDKEFLDKYHGFPFVAGIDIFPLDYVAPDEEEENLRKCMVSLVSGVANSITIENENTDLIRNQIAEIEELCNVKLDYGQNMKKQLLALEEQLFSLYSAEESTEIVLMPYWIQEGTHKYPSEYFDKIIRVPFETMEIQIPAAYDGVLQIEYSDYMKVIKGGAIHDYPFYGKQQKQLRKLTKQRSFRQSFSINDVINEEIKMKKNPKEQVEELLQLLEQVHENIYKALEAEKMGLATQQLEDCQSGAIQIGNLIEKMQGEGFITVKLLEQYCEVIYQIHEEVSKDYKSGTVDISCELKEQLDRIKKSVKKDFIMRKKMAFLPYKASMWDSLESVWRAANEDPDCDAYVIPIPYYDKNPDGSFGEMHYEGDQYPKGVPIVNYESFDFQNCHFDKIFIHNPYDEYNFVTSVHPFFYSKNMKQYTEELIYIPYFVLEDINPDDPMTAKNMEHFVTVSAVVHADKVIVQSEKMRTAYINFMTEFAGKNTANIWEKKILGLGSPKFDKIISAEKEDLALPDEWRTKITKKDGSSKKVILYNTSISALLQYESKMIEKMKKVFRLLEKNQEDITLLWRPHPLIKATISSMRPQLWEEYEKLVQWYKEENVGIYDETSDLDRAILLCDAYYGDRSSVVQLCRKVGKPVMIEEIDF